ncbi:MAG: carboxyl transferase domain-containing protein [Oscillospiraceae bacterium]
MQINNASSKAVKRLEMLFDDGTFTEIGSALKQKENLSGVVTAFGYVNGNPVYAYSQDKSVNGGAVGMAQADKIAKLYSLSAKTGTPIVGIYDSNGAYVDVDALTGYGKMINASAIVSGVVPQISLIMGTCAGSSSILACTSDFVVMTEDSEFFLSPVPENDKTGAGTSKACMKAGMVSAVCPTEDKAIKKVRDILNLMPVNNISSLPQFEYDEPNGVIGKNVTTIVKGITDDNSIVELSDGFGKASYTALATIGGATVGIVGTDKTNDKLSADDCSKIARFVRMCDAFSIPIVTLLNSEGFDCTTASETAGAVRDITKLADAYAEATTVKISIVTGNAYGVVFTAMAGKSADADFTYAWNNAIISPLAPLTAVEFLWHDKLKGAKDVKAKRNELAKEYSYSVANAMVSAEKGAIDEVISPSDTRKVLISALDILSSKRVETLSKKHSNITL